MLLPPGVLAARRLIAVVCAVLALVAVVGALAYASQDVGNGCGSGWAAAHKPLPSPLLTDAEKAAILKAKGNPYVVASAKARPFEACRRAGSHRLIRAGLAAALILLPLAGLLAVLYWPRRADPVEEPIELDDEQPAGGPPPPPKQTTGWPGR